MSFDAFLRDLEERLEVPYPARRDVVLEIGAHLDALYDDLVRDGFPPDEAHARALEAMSADAGFVREMDAVHRPAVARALARMPRVVSLGLEYGVIGAIGATLFLSVIFEEKAMIDFMLSGGFFMLPLNLAGLAIVVLGVERIYSLFVKKDHSATNLRRRLLSLRFLAVACALTGIVGTLVGFYNAFAAADRLLETYGGQFPIYEVVRIALTTSIWGLTLSLLALVVRYVAEAKASRIEGSRVYAR